ncbi:hypothetical protein [Amycolatopsis sp. Hca4]|uniref:hypothetical protein n=1 Tax=Amycolatopsis sp. Hca4 TaxID=2742131 RepID=UPI00159036FC|nr:hypothetical protein [Amycolatopsis sp. Hca4]QKV74124.1 hypothetical protein HUT10_10360 [Amycolatopsis sp. Hca4]
MPFGEIAKVAGHVAGGLKAAHGMWAAVPPGKKDKGAKAAARGGAYLGFLVATGDLLTWFVELGAIALASRQWEPFQWRHTTTVMYLSAEARKSFSGYLAALSEIRLVGNPEPRAAAEEITAIVAQLFDCIPTERKAADRAAQLERAGAWQLRLGEAQKDFVLVARRDVGTAKKLRTYWWQLWRSRTVEEWPGGWPGPTVTPATNAEATT